MPNHETAPKTRVLKLSFYGEDEDMIIPRSDPSRGQLFIQEQRKTKMWSLSDRRIRCAIINSNYVMCVAVVEVIIGYGALKALENCG